MATTAKPEPTPVIRYHYKDLTKTLEILLGDHYDPKARYTLRNKGHMPNRELIAVVETDHDGEMYLYKD